MRRVFVSLAAAALLCSTFRAHGQQAPPQDRQSDAEQQATPPASSLGEIARQLKLKKQRKEAQLVQAKANQDPQPAEAQPAHIVTNDEAPEQASVTPAAEPRKTGDTSGTQLAGEREEKGERWKGLIQEQKAAITALQQQIDEVSKSIHYAGANCIANCAQWNESQQHKQQQVDAMKSQVEELKKRLEELQDSARKEGYGSPIYDP